MIRLGAIIIAAYFFLSSTVSATEIHPREISLRTSIIVDTEYITLYDLFGVSDKRESKKVAYSPRPGHTASFDAKWLYRVARAYNLNWRPMNRNTRVIVERASQMIERDEIEKSIIASLRENGVTDNFEISTRRFQKIYVAANQFASVGIEHLTYEPDNGRFIANLTAPANHPSAQRFRVSGRVYKLRTIPILNKRLRRGDLINKNDVEWIDFRISKIKKNTILEEEDLIGMAAKRTIREEYPISFSQIRKPILITKGGLVTINLTTSMMRLTSQGKALQEGSRGDTIQVKNIQSNKTIEARVTGINNVTVDLLSGTTLN